MWCIVYHNDVMGFEVFILHITLWKVFIVFHKSNDLTTMKKHLKLRAIPHFKIPWKCNQYGCCSTCAWTSQKESTCDTIYHFVGFFILLTSLRRIMKPRLVSLRIYCYCWLRATCPWRLLIHLAQRFAYRLCPKVVFLNKKVSVDEVLHGLVEKTMVIYV
jgi:hypothetical protein